jgi:hypothetical protein
MALVNNHAHPDSIGNLALKPAWIVIVLFLIVIPARIHPPILSSVKIALTDLPF